MPIRVEQIPNLESDDGYRIPRADPAAAAAPGRALGDLGSSIASAGHAFMGVAIDAQRADNMRTVLQTQNQMEEAGQQHLEELNKDPDPAGYAAKTRDFLAQKKAEIDATPMSKDVRDEVNLSYDRIAHRLIMQSVGNAARVTQQRAGEAWANSYQRNVQNGDRAGMLRDIEAAKKVTMVTAEQEESTMRSFDADVQKQQALAQVKERPLEWIEQNKDGPPAGQNRVLFYQMKGEAHQNYAQVVAKDTQDFHDQVAAKNITTRDHVDTWAGQNTVSPDVKKQYYDYLDSIVKGQGRQVSTDPAQIKSSIGDISAKISGYSIDQPGFDERYVAIKNQIASEIPEGPDRKELEDNLDAARTGQRATIQSNVDGALQQMDADYQGGAFSGLTTRETLGMVLNSRFIGQENMQKEGFSWDQIKAVRALDEDEELAKKGTQAVVDRQVELIRSFYPFRPFAQGASSGPEAKAIWDAIVTNKPAAYQLDWRTAAELAQGRKAYGAARASLMQWARLHPDKAKDSTEVERARLQAIRPEAKDSGSNSVLDEEPPAFDWNAPSVLPEKPRPSAGESDPVESNPIPAK